MAAAAQTAPTAAAPTKEAEAAPAPATPEICGEERLKKAEAIVKSNMKWAAGLGAVPVPAVDLIGVGAVQLRMIRDISELYGVHFKEKAAKNIITALVGTLGNSTLTVLAMGTAIKTLPFAGALIGGVLCMPIIAGATTYAIGRTIVRHFEGGGTFADLSVEKAKAFFREQFAQGKKLATDVAPAKA